MKVLFHRYGSICEPDIINVFLLSGLEVTEDKIEISQKNIPGDIRIKIIADYLFESAYSFVFSINFFPYISDVCEKFQIPYVCYSVDCPVLELFSQSIHNSMNRIFLFDYSQYSLFHPQNPDHIYYLPLATNPSRWDQVLDHISPEDRYRYSGDISFVGSLYIEKSPFFSQIIPEHIRGYIDGISQSQLLLPECNFSEDLIMDELLTYLKDTYPNFPSIPDAWQNTDTYAASHLYLDMHVSALERLNILQKLSSKYSVNLYTRSDSSALPDITAKGGVSTLTEMPKVFNLSKINLNITMRSIQSGLPLRIFDIMGCHGFLLSDYQSELPEYFQIGNDCDCYETFDELDEKVNYYLTHDDIRMEIAENGYQKVIQHHTWFHRVSTILKTVF